MLFRFKAILKLFGKELIFEKGSAEATTEVAKLVGTILAVGIDLTLWVKL